MINFLRHIKQKFNTWIHPPQNMYLHQGEQHYYELYEQYINPYLKANQHALDIGSQYGRFTIPMLEKGLKVTATDTDLKYGQFIQKRVSNSEQFTFREENIETTIQDLAFKSFDHLLCLELLYNLKNGDELLNGLSDFLKDGGMSFISYRTYGYYLYRFLKEENFEAIHEILEGNHQDYQAHSKLELEKLYQGAGLSIQKIIPIGMFSGFGSDAFTPIYDSSDGGQDELVALENDGQLQEMFVNNARYLLVIAQKKP